MEIRPAFNSGVAGFQGASEQLSNASSRIASLGTTEKGAGEQSVSEMPISITTELINMKIAELQAVASAKVISSADELVGTLIDTSV